MNFWHTIEGEFNKWTKMNMPEQRSERKSIWVHIKLGDKGYDEPPDFDLRETLSDAVEERGIGEWEGSGSGGGWMDFSFGVENIQAVNDALNILKNVLAQYEVPDDVIRLEVVSKTDDFCDDLPDFQPGDCLSYRFEDGEYGAAIVLQAQPDELNTGTWQTGKPPVGDKPDKTLLGLLDYKSLTRPQPSLFEQRQWLLRTHEASKGQPYLVWVNCFGGIEIEVVHHTRLKDDDLIECRFNLSWEDLPEYFIRDKYRDNPELNRYETIGDNAPDFQPGDCLSYRFEDGEYGAALVLKRIYDGTNRNETLLGILDYKSPTPPQATLYEQRNWLIARQEWRKGQPYLIVAQFCWSSDCAGLEVEVITRVSLNTDDPMLSPFCLYWEDIPEFVLWEKN